MVAMNFIAISVLLAFCGRDFVKGAVPTWSTPSGGDATVSIAEGSSGTAVETLAATDSDGGTVTYTLISQTPSSPTYFAVASGGAVTTSAVTDYETMTDKVFTVLVLATSDTAATDTATGTLTVSITDANDNTPAFAGTTGSVACISSSSGSGTTVATRTASDNDGTAANNVISAYAIGSGDASSQFSISSAGVVTRTAVALDATVQDIYALVLQAVDSGGSALTGTTTLFVFLDNDNICSGASMLAGSLVVSLVIFLIAKAL